MQVIKKIKLVVFFFLFFFFIFTPFFESQGEDVLEDAHDKEVVEIHFFEYRYCSVCREAKEFIKEIKEDYPEIELIIYPISEIDREKFDEIGKMHGVENLDMTAPTIFIGDNYFQFINFTKESENDLIRAIEGEVVDRDCCMLTIPLINLKVNTKDWSLPFVTIIMGSLDGFNVCSLGALILILSIVIGFKSRKKILIYGGLFIFVTVTVYGLLVFAWRSILYEPLVVHMENIGIFIGIFAFLGGLYFFREFWRFFRYGPTCKTSQSKLAQKATQKLQKAFENPTKGALALAGSVAFFAVTITLVELPCSIGIPVIYTGILADAGISITESIFYILLYLFFYMLIEVVIFIGAVLTKEIWMMNSKAITWITFVGAMIMFYLAYYYLIAT